MTDWANLQIPCKICGASVLQTIEPSDDGAKIIFDKMPQHLEWHKQLQIVLDAKQTQSYGGHLEHAKKMLRGDWDNG